MRSSKPDGTPIEAEVRALISRIARGAPEAGESADAQSWALGPRQLTRAAVRLLEGLPAELRLVALRGQYPRILNRVAEAWPSPVAFDALTRSLLIDERGQRQGFPMQVITEITDLREHYFTVLHPQARARLGPPAPPRAR